MMNFLECSSGGKTAITALCFLSFCVSLFLSFTVYQGRRRLPKILLPIGSVISGTVVILYADTLRAMRQDKPTSAVSDMFCEWSVWIPIVFSVVLLMYGSFTVYKELRYRKTTLTRSAIRESVDKVSSGLCFYDESGRIILMNNCMNELCHKIVGRDLQNAAIFWDILSGGEILETVTRLTDNENPTFRLSDGSVWAFARENPNGILQIIASEVTQLQAVTDELKEKNAQLAAMNVRLRQYGENVDELTRSKERLEIKVHLHRELGQTLLATRHYLLDDDHTYPAPTEQWQKNIAMLRKEAEPPRDEHPMAMLTHAAKTMGVGLSIEGELPEDERLQKLFTQAAAEALTNAISHAGAKSLFIRLSHDEKTYTACYRNDGVQPQTAVVEGGGLGSLRRKIEGEGGDMTVKVQPEFVLVVTLPKKGRDMI